MQHDDALDPWFVTGLVDGEGSFTFSRNRSQNVGLYFSLKLTAADRELLERVQSFFGVGKLYDVKPRLPRAASGFTKASVFFRVTRQDSLRRIVDHFDRYPLQGSKRLAFNAWRRVLDWKRANFRRPTTGELVRLLEELSAAQIRNQSWS